nr:EscU/YscU/HrcU family type III secretion system export apparatus switch protein [Bradyrhizobium huanghuaihaiense]
MGGAAGNRAAAPRRDRRAQPGDVQGRAQARRYRRARRHAAAAGAGPRRPLPGPRHMSDPSKLAIALHYEKGSGAPVVVAKGKGTIGEKIVEIAKANDIPIEENEILAGALSKVELGEEIPPDLYKAVAEVLVFVLRLSGRGR